MRLQPYLFFDGRCAEAVAFYRQALDAQVEMVMHYKDAPEQNPDMHAGYGDKVIHASVRVGDTALMMSDDCMSHPLFGGFSLSLTVTDEREAKRKFEALGAGGKVQMPLSATFFSPCFGMVVDRFGVQWMVMVPGPEA